MSARRNSLARAVGLRIALASVEPVNRIGGRARLTIYPDAGHNGWDRACHDPALWDWMLAQER